jgi:hypothetical protein
LQAVDYFTWALQRLYEKREDRYLSYFQDSIYLVMDIDDKRSTKYGVCYSQKKATQSSGFGMEKQNKLARAIGLCQLGLQNHTA